MQVQQTSSSFAPQQFHQLNTISINSISPSGPPPQSPYLESSYFHLSPESTYQQCHIPTVQQHENQDLNFHKFHNYPNNIKSSHLLATLQPFLYQVIILATTQAGIVQTFPLHTHYLGLPVSFTNLIMDLLHPTLRQGQTWRARKYHMLCQLPLVWKEDQVLQKQEIAVQSMMSLTR